MSNYLRRIISILLLTAITLSFFTSCGKDDVFYTDNIKDYCTEKYSIPSTFFLSKLPSNANVKAFSNYRYWHELFDVYLELEFNSKEEMEAYISLLVNNDLNSNSKNNREEPNNGWIVEVRNPYDDSYTDLLSTELTSGTIDARWGGL